MDRRYELHDELTELLGTEDCYYQPPESIKLRYPCIIYSRDANYVARADNLAYRQKHRYNLIYITYDPDDPLVDEIERHFPMCRFDRFYAADSLNHYSFTLYY